MFAAVAEMRGQQGVKLHIVTSQSVGDENDVSARVGNHFDHQAVSVALMSDLRQWHAIFRYGDLIAVDALDLKPAGWSCHYESEIANLRLTGRGPVDLVEDAVTQRDPYPASAERGRHYVLRARCPGWPGARTSRCDGGSQSSPRHKLGTSRITRAKPEVHALVQAGCSRLRSSCRNARTATNTTIR